MVSGSAAAAAATAWSITERREGALSRTCVGTQVSGDLASADVLSGHVNRVDLQSGRCTKGGETGKATWALSLRSCASSSTRLNVST